MPTHVDLLRDLHRLQRHLHDLKAETEKGPLLLKAQKTKLTRHEHIAREAHEKLQQLKVLLREKEGALKSIHETIAKHEKQLNEAGSKKEYDALQSEITLEKQKSVSLEDEILAGMAEVDERTAQLPELEKALAQVKEETANFDHDEQERQARIVKELDSAIAQLAEAEKLLPSDIKSLYDRLVAAHGANAIAAIEDGTCSFCYNAITPQQQRELDAGRFNLCKSCGHMVYPAR